ncbi:hypothetical protein NPIL_501661, partial [Nephila pilipes]
EHLRYNLSSLRIFAVVYHSTHRHLPRGSGSRPFLTKKNGIENHRKTRFETRYHTTHGHYLVCHTCSVN